jgi:hypothetical protein
MERLGEGVGLELRRIAPATQGDIAAIVAAWPELAGETVARNAWPLRVARDGTLNVATTSSTWAFELGRLAPMLLERLRERLGSRAPAGLRFAPGPVPAAASPRVDEIPHSVAASADERLAGAELAASIADPELRELVSRAAAASLARGRSDHRF